MIHFSNNLKYLRKQKNLSQTQLASQTGLSRGNISSYEKGTSLPNVKKIYSIAQFFDISMDHLVTVNIVNPTKTPMMEENGFLKPSPQPLHGSGDMASLQMQNARFVKMLQGIRQYHRFKQEGEDPYPSEFNNILIDIERLADISMALLEQNTLLIDRLENRPSKKT